MNALRVSVALILLILLQVTANAQCPQIIDGNGNASAIPRWVHCNGTGYTLFIQTTIATGSYTINWGDGTSSTGASLVPPTTVSHTYPATLRNYTITFSEPGKACVITGLLVIERPVNASITRPVGSGGATTICAPGSLDFINSSTDASVNTTFRWDFGDGSADVVKGANDSGVTTSHTYLRNTVNCNTIVTLEAENFCTTVPSFASVGPINIYDIDDAGITPTATVLCYPDTQVGFLNTSNLNCRPQGNTTQRFEYWNFGNYWGGGDSLLGWLPFANPPSQTYQLKFPGKGTYTVTMVDSNLCGRDTTQQTIVIGDPPVALLTSDLDTVCAGNRIRFFNNTAGVANQSQWNFGDGVWRVRNMNNQNRTFNTPGTYTIQLAVFNTNGSGSCTDTISKQIHVLPGPTSAFTLSPAQGCDSLLVGITENSADAAKWLWNFGDGTTDTNSNPLNHFYDTIGNYNLSLTVTHSNGCTDSSTQVVNIFSSPIVDFTPKNVCEGVLASFTDNTVVPSGQALVSWAWSFGDGGTSAIQNPFHTYAASGTYLLKLTASTANCASTDSFNIVVEPKPTADFSMSDTIGCSPLAVNFTNTSLISTNYIWDFGDGDTSHKTTPTHNFVNATAATVGYNVTLYANTAFGCSDTLQKSVQVYAVPNATFTSTAIPECGPSEVDFTNTSTGGISNYWDFDDGDTSTASNPSHTFQNKTLFIEVYTVKLIVTSSNGCTDTAFQNVVVYPEPIFTFQSIPDTGCSPLLVQFPSITGAVAYKWYFGDGDSTFGPSPSHVYTNSTTNNVLYTATLIATSSFGCSDTNLATILVHPNPTASFSVSDSVNCQPHAVSFTNVSTGAIAYKWNFGDGDTSNSGNAIVNHTFSHNQSSTQNYQVRLIAETQEGCFDTTVHQVSTFPKVIADYQPSDTAGCTPLSVTFNDNSMGGQFYTWTFGDNNSSAATSPSHTYRNTTLVDEVLFPKLVVSSQFGCVDSLLDTIVVHPLPIAQFNHPIIRGCHELQVQFNNTSSIADTNSWDFGDGNILGSNNNTINHTYTNTGTTSIFRDVKLNVETRFGCKDSADSRVEIYPEIISKFKQTDTVGCSPLAINFTDSAKGAQFYIWDFGDNVNAGSKNTSHVFQNSLLKDTVYTVQQKVRSAFGCEDSSTIKIRVYPLPIASFNTTVLRGCQPLQVGFTNNSRINAKSYWGFGDGDTSLSNGNTTHSFQHNDVVSKTFTAQLIVETNKGCRDTTSKQVEVYPKISADFTISDTSGCSEHDVVFTNASSGENQYDWNFGDGNTDRVGDPRNTFVNADTVNRQFTIRLKVSSVYGCEDSVFKTVTVFPQPKAIFVATPANQKYPNATVVYSNNSSAGPWNYSWDFGDGKTSAVKFPNDKLHETWGEYKITLIASNPICADTVSQTIKIEPPRAVLDFDASGVGCSPLVVTVKNRSIFGKQFIWNFGDGGISNVENPAPYIYNRPGVYTISLTVIGEDNDVVLETKKDSVVVQAAARAFFDYRPNEVNVPNDPLILFNLSDDSDKWLWNLGDGTTYTDQNPEHTYQEAGIYTITLIADNEFGCADTFSVESAVTAISSGSLKFPTAFIPNIGGSSGGNYDPKTLDNSIFFPIFEGVVDYHLLIFNRWGEIVFESKDVLIGWDGYYRGTETMCAQDVYIWKVTGKYVNGKTFDEAGEVTLLK